MDTFWLLIALLVVVCGVPLVVASCEATKPSLPVSGKPIRGDNEDPCEFTLRRLEWRFECAKRNEHRVFKEEC